MRAAVSFLNHLLTAFLLSFVVLTLLLLMLITGGPPSRAEAAEARKAANGVLTVMEESLHSLRTADLEANTAV